MWMFSLRRAKVTKELLYKSATSPRRKKRRERAMKLAIPQNQRLFLLIRSILTTKYATLTSIWSTGRTSWISTAICTIAALLSISLMTHPANSTYFLTKNSTNPPNLSSTSKRECRRRKKRPNPRPRKPKDEYSD